VLCVLYAVLRGRVFLRGRVLCCVCEGGGALVLLWSAAAPPVSCAGVFSAADAVRQLFAVVCGMIDGRAGTWRTMGTSS